MSINTYLYYVLDDGAGEPLEIYRSPFSEASFHERLLERAKQNGQWSSASGEVDIIINRWMVGDFDPKIDEISEIKAFSYLKQWRKKNWPGRP